MIPQHGIRSHLLAGRSQWTLNRSNLPERWRRFSSSIIAGMLVCGACNGYGSDARSAFQKLIDRPRVEPGLRIENAGITNDLWEAHFSFASERDVRVPGLLVEPTNQAARHPAAIVMHGTGGKKEDEWSLLRRLAQRGFVAAAIDGRQHGERRQEGGSREYNAAIARAYEGSGEHPLYYDTVWDIERLVDVLQARTEVDSTRIGLSGISKGGIETYLTAAADERITAAVPFIGVQDFQWGIEHEAWRGRIGTFQSGFNMAARNAGVTNAGPEFVRAFYDRVAPGIYGEFDGPRMLELIAPRALLMVNSDSDDHTPLTGVENCDKAAQAAYAKLGASEHFAVIIQKNTGHRVNSSSEAAMIDWFARWLKPDVSK